MDGQFEWCTWAPDDSFHRQLIPRDDNYIGVKEATAVALLMETWKQRLANTMLTLYTDNMGVLHGLLRGDTPNTLLDAAMIVQGIWHTAADMRCALFAAYVHTLANPADDPSRGRTDLMDRLGATRREAVLPTWVVGLWHGQPALRLAAGGVFAR